MPMTPAPKTQTTVARTFVWATDGTPIFVRDYSATDDDAPTLFVVHGACEHGGRYRHVAEEFTKLGWRVIVPDLRGHGRSGGEAMFVRYFDDYLADLNALLEHFSSNPARTVMLGHSMGGLVTARFAQKHPDRIAASVLSSPLLRVRVPIPISTLVLGKVLSVATPRFRFRSRISPSDVVKNEESQQQRKRDPYLQRSVTAGWFFAMRRALGEVWNDSQKMRTPLLVMQAGDDRIVDNTAAKNWFDALPGTKRRLHAIPDAYHELFNELDWRATVRLVADWLTETVNLPPSSNPPN